MRKIIFDIETTGLDKKTERIIEIAAVELLDYSKTGRNFQTFVCPGKIEVKPGAFRIHGIDNDFLKDKPQFSSIFPDFWNFFNENDAEWVAHNAEFDVGFINSELNRLGKSSLDPTRVIDTLAIAKRKHPTSRNDLNSLCKRYGISISQRVKHSALLDSELLADVYIKMMLGDSQIGFGFTNSEDLSYIKENNRIKNFIVPIRKNILPLRITKEELQEHDKIIKKIGKKSIWTKYSSYE
ncbi:DNA polymerase III subunit epsilon [Candidatus Liberibacter sp.]|uniref:DNA polymerase III subunit epsilon n=1 Tax=Candidatus Liberibacter sp. TaxID=34022 RepID=UPI0015F37565|nr:DNA polymerase III subunit epsilon [Candidatus Liberibacter sp.]MBA5723972.1 DNA polymerase III subunit epsilon [Candidatus Liberibacter sp.]